MTILATPTRWLAAAFVLVGGAAAYGADTYSAGQLTIPTLVIGNATYSNVVVKVAGIVSGPAGSGPVGAVDTYNPANGYLTVQSVSLGSVTVYNVVVTVSNLVSIGSVSGADTYNGSTLSVPIVDSNFTMLSNATYKPTAAPQVGGGLPTALYDSYSGGALTIPAVTYSGHVFTNVTVQATQESVGSTNQTLTFSKPVYSIEPLPVGNSEAILATASSGLPVTYVVTSPTVCMIAPSSAQEGYGFIQYSASGGAGSGVVGAAPLGSGAFQANSFTGFTTTGTPLGLAMASSALNPYPSSAQDYTPPYPNFELQNDDWLFDDVLFVNGGPLVDIAGIALTASNDPIINILYENGQGYLYADSIILAAMGNYQSMTMSARIVSGLVGLADGVCTVSAFQPGNGSFSAAAPVSVTVDVGVITLP